MSRDETETPPMIVLRKFAMRFPEAEEGTSCVNRAFRARGKAYAYVGRKGPQYKLMVKLEASLPEAQKLAKQRPDHYRPGKAGWTTVWLPHEEAPPAGLLESWIEESFRLLVHRDLVAELPAEGIACQIGSLRKKRSPAKKSPAKKKGAGKLRKSATKRPATKKKAAAKKTPAKKASARKTATKKLRPRPKK